MRRSEDAGSPAYTRRDFGKMMSLSALAIGAGVGARARAATPALIEAANKEGKLVVYGDSSMIPSLIEGFSKRYPGIQVTSVPNSEWAAYNRFASEQAAGRTIADVLVGGDGSLLTADRAGYLGDTHLDDVTDYPARSLPHGAHYVSPQGMLTTVIYNKPALAGRKLPQDWADFANMGKEWDNQIIVADIRNSGSTLSVFTALYVHMGPELATKIVTGLKNSRAEIAPTTGVQVAKLVSGEKPLTATLTMTFYQQMLGQGAPMDFLLPTSGVIMQRGGMAVTKNSAHPNAGRLFVDFCMSSEGAAIYTAQGNYPARNGSPAPDGFPALSSLKVLELDTSQVLSLRSDVIKWWLTNMGVS